MLFGEKKEASLKVEGMTCGHCANTVANALKGVSGVRQAQVDLEEGRARVTYDPSKLGTDDLVHAVQRAGYQASPGA